MNANTIPLHKFNGTMLAEARMARALTLTQLGEISGVSKQSLSNYEKGKQDPRADSAERLAQSLNVPLALLYSEPVSDENTPVYFRSLANLNKTERIKADIKLQWLARILNSFEKHLDFVQPNLPANLDISDRYQMTSGDEIEDIALGCRRHFGLGDGPISNITMLLENNGVILVTLPLNIKSEDAYSRWVLNSKYPVAVLISEGKSACRDRFSLAHELGHLVMHKNVHPTKLNHKLIEEQANRFASAFLLPSHSYTRDFGYPSLDVFRLLKEKWKVSIQAQVVRCKQLGIISEDSAKKFFIHISKRKWRTQEPLDDVIQPEKAKVIKEATKLLCIDGGLSMEDISHETLLSVDDIAQLTGYEVEKIPSEEPLKPTLKTQNNVIQFPQC